jgi:hypothetical protein
MKAIIVRVSEKRPSRTDYQGNYYYIFFRDVETGLTHRSCLYDTMRNFYRWKPVIEAVNAGENVMLDNLKFKEKNIIDADSVFTRVACECPPKINKIESGFMQGNLFGQDGIKGLDSRNRRA